MAQQRRAHMVVESAGAEKERRSWEPTRSLIVTESPLSLPQWLEVSWFYPEGFVKERIVETERSFVVLGNGIAYKFLKTSPERHFSARWQAACEEVLDNISLAPELYLGLRVLRWIDDEPHWFSEYRSADLDPLRPPADADDVAIIMRRIPDGEMLHQALAAHRRRTDQTLRAAARTLRRFHEGQQRVPRPEAFPLSQNSLRRIYLAPLQRFIAEDAHSLDTFTHYALREVAFWINAFLEREEPRLRARRKLRTVIDCHGSLRADRIATLDPDESIRTTLLFGRLPRHDTVRVNDLLSDVAALSSDLRARGFAAQAETFERRYFTQRQDGSATTSIDDPLYRFFLVAESVRRAVLLLSGSVEDRHATATSYLALAMRGALQLHAPLFVVISGDRLDETTRLAEALNTYVGCSVLAPRTHRPPSLRAAADDLELDALLQRGERRIRQGISVALIWPIHRRHERERLEQMLAELAVPSLFIHAESDTSERIGSGSGTRPAEEELLGRRRTLGARELLTGDGEIPLLVLDPNLHPADAALNALHALRQGYALARRAPTRKTSPLR